jgi:hypothetical protein
LVAKADKGGGFPKVVPPRSLLPCLPWSPPRAFSDNPVWKRVNTPRESGPCALLETFFILGVYSKP